MLSAEEVGAIDAVRQELLAAGMKVVEPRWLVVCTMLRKGKVGRAVETYNELLAVLEDFGIEGDMFGEGWRAELESGRYDRFFDKYEVCGEGGAVRVGGGLG